MKNSKNWWNSHQTIPKTAFTNTCYMPFCRELNSMKNCAYHFKNSDWVENLWIKNWIYHCPNHCPDRCSDKSPDLLKRMQKCPKKRKLERERSLRCPYDVIIMSLWCPFMMSPTLSWSRWQKRKIYCKYFIYVPWCKHPI